MRALPAVWRRPVQAMFSRSKLRRLDNLTHGAIRCPAITVASTLQVV